MTVLKKIMLKYIPKKSSGLSLLFSFILLFVSLVAISQPKAGVLDEITAVVGAEILLSSEIENQIIQMKQQGMQMKDDTRCALYQEMLFQKLMLHQSKIDSLEVNDEQVEGEIERRIRYFVSQIGSVEKLEEYYGKKVAEIKDEFRELIKDQLLIQQMEAKIFSDITVTPSEIKAFFKNIHEDSIPFINAEVEMAQIVIQPKVNDEAKKETRAKLMEIKDRILKGGNFAALARIYSEDPGSAKKGGELGFVERGTFVPEFEAAAFSLNQGEVSEIIETQFGYHILELIQRRGEQINVRHILLKPKITDEDLSAASLKIDSVYGALQSDSISFSKAASKYSTDELTRNNGGVMINPATGSTRWEMDQMDRDLFFIIDKLKVGEYSKPIAFFTPEGEQAIRIVLLKSRSEPHRANLKDDYQRITEAAKQSKENNIRNKWIKKTISGTYIKLHDDFKSCNTGLFKEQSELKY